MTARKTRVRQHMFTPDPDLGVDHQGRQVCATCHLPGRSGDAHHTMPDVPEQAEARRWAGEREDGT